MKIKDIAKIAGVSNATVSMVLNNKKGIGINTQRKVLKVAKEAGYFYSDNNKYNKKQLGNILVFQFAKNGAHISNEIVEGIEIELLKRRYRMDFIATNAEKINKILEKVQYIGIIVLGNELRKKDMLTISKIKIPAIVINNYFIDIAGNYVVIDSFKRINKIIDILKANGHKKIGYLKSQNRNYNNNERLEAYKKRLGSKDVFESSTDLKHTYSDIKKYMLKYKKIPTVFISEDNELSKIILKTINDLNIGKSEKVQIVEFTKSELDSNYKNIKTILPENERMGIIAAKTLCEIITSKKNEKYMKITLNSDLKVSSFK